MIEKPSDGRAIIEQGFNTLTITIPSKKNWFIIIFMCVWLCGWAVGEVSAIQMFTGDAMEFEVTAFMTVWLIGWTIGGAFVVLTILWQLFGREVIHVEWGVLKIEKSIFGQGLKKQYDIPTIKNLMFSPKRRRNNYGEEENSNTFGINEGRIKFDYGYKTIKFANDIDEAEARMIIKLLKENTNFERE